MSELTLELTNDWSHCKCQLKMQLPGNLKADIVIEIFSFLDRVSITVLQCCNTYIYFIVIVNIMPLVFITPCRNGVG